eukprot:7513626-Pyramimonas_sp.AAC.1
MSGSIGATGASSWLAPELGPLSRGTPSGQSLYTGVHGEFRHDQSRLDPPPEGQPLGTADPGGPKLLYIDEFRDWAFVDFTVLRAEAYSKTFAPPEHLPEAPEVPETEEEMAPEGQFVCNM